MSLEPTIAPANFITLLEDLLMRDNDQAFQDGIAFLQKRASKRGAHLYDEAFTLFVKYYAETKAREWRAGK